MTEDEKKAEYESNAYSTCVVCGKHKFTACTDLSRWVYQKNGQWCCSWTCYNKLPTKKKYNKPCK